MTFPLSDPGVHCPRVSDLVLHAWDDGAVVYDNANGNLYALSPIAGEALRHLLNSLSFNAQSLAQALMQEDPGVEDISMVARLIGEFESMGFVEGIAG